MEILPLLFINPLTPFPFPILSPGQPRPHSTRTLINPLPSPFPYVSLDSFHDGHLILLLSLRFGSNPLVCVCLDLTTYACLGVHFC